MFEEAELDILVKILELQIKKHGEYKYMTLGNMLKIITEAKVRAKLIREAALNVYDTGLTDLKKE